MLAPGTPRPAAKARPGDKVAVLSPSFAAPAIHEQGLRRLQEVTGLVPVEYPTTRRLDARPEDRAADLKAAFADPAVRAVVATIGGEDQITVVPHVDGAAVRADPKPFIGYSDNTNLLNHLWTAGVSGFYGGSTQVHLGPGPAVDPVHAASLRAALVDGGRLEVTTGHTWGGCLEVLQWLLTAGRFPDDPEVLRGGVLLVETSEELIPAREVGFILRSLGERGVLAAVDAVVAARPPTSDFAVRSGSSPTAAR